MKKKKWLTLGAPLAAIILAVLLVIFLKGNNKNGVEFKIEKIKKGDIEAIVSTTGTVNPVTIIEVGSQVSGRIAKIYVDFNSKVKAGQIIAEIDPSQILTRIKQNEANYESSRAAVEKAKVSLENSKKIYQRALQLAEKELISFEEKENAEAQYLTAKTEVESAQARLLQSKSQLDSEKVNLDYSIIKSPIDGIVINRKINVGQTVAASFQSPVLFEIANDLSKMQVECSIDEADIGKIKEGMESKFTVDAFPDDNFVGSVTQVRYSPLILQNVVTYTTIIEVNNSNLKLRPGMTATVSIITGKANNVLIVANSALRFNPPLSAEEWKTIMQKMREEMGKNQKDNPNNGSNQSRGNFSSMGMPGGDSGQGDRSQRRRQFSMLWILDDQGKLKPIMIKPGVADDSNTEIKWGAVTEGQEVIAGLLSGSLNNEQNFGPMGMMFRR